MSKWEMVRLGDYIEQIRGVSYKPEDSSDNEIENHVAILRAHNIQDAGLNFEKVIFVNTKNIRHFQMLRKGDIVVCASSGSKELVGKAAQVTTDMTVSFGAFCKVIRPKSIIVSIYLKHFFRSSAYRFIISELSAGANINNLRNEHIDELKILLPPFPTQQKIADILDRANALIEKRKAQLEKLDLLVKSQFVEMFGNPVINPMRWEVRLLGELGELKNGINFNLQDKGYTIKCLGVGDFGSLYKIDDMDRIKEVSLSSDYLLKNGDIVFVRSNGNRELVGRCIEIFPHSTKVTFSGFCIRYRNENENILTGFLNHVLHSKSMKSILLKDGRGANIQNINQQMLSALSIYVR